MGQRDIVDMLEDMAEKYRKPISYIILVLAFAGAVLGWFLLPDMVSLSPGEASVLIQTKFRTVIFILLMTLGFDSAFWKWPRKLPYLLGGIIGVCLPLILTYLNLGG